MDNGGTLKQIEQALRAGLSELGMSDLTSRGTTLLIRDGHYVGRRFAFDGVQAVWLAAEKILCFYDDNGQMLKNVDIATIQEQKKAA